MHQLDPFYFAQARPLFESLEFHRAVGAVFDGTTPARVYVDSRENPQIGLIWYKNRVYLAGAPAADGAVAAVRQLLVDEVCRQARMAGEALLLLYVAPDEWAQQIDAILPDQRPVRVERQYYEFRHATLDWRTQLPADFTLCLADAALLAQEQLLNRDALMEEMCSERASVADFLAQSFGVCLLHGDEIAGWCLSEYNSPTGCEVGIATGEAVPAAGAGHGDGGGAGRARPGAGDGARGLGLLRPESSIRGYGAEGWVRVGQGVCGVFGLV